MKLSCKLSLVNSHATLVLLLYVLTAVCFYSGESSGGGSEDPTRPTKSEVPEVAASPTSNGPTFSSGEDRNSLDDYDGEDDDFSEHGSFIGQYGNGETQATQPSFV